MAKLRITGGRPLSGVIKAQGSKNAVLPILAATLLSDQPIVLENVPQLSDVGYLGDILTSLGKSVSREDANMLRITQASQLSGNVPQELVGKMRASFLVLGPLLAKLGHAEVSLPGGDRIGSRPVDIHLEGLKAMGAEIEIGEGGIVHARALHLNPAEIHLRFPSVGATEHLMMTAALIPGKTRIHNPAREPEIGNLAQLLSAMGARIELKPDKVIIEGAHTLDGTALEIIPDRLHAGTFMIAAGLCGEGVKIECEPEHVSPLTGALKQAGVSISVGSGSLEISKPPGRYSPLDIETGPYPKFATDHHPMLVPLLALADGTSRMTENVFEGRFGYVEELREMGASIMIDGRTAIIEGVERLQGANVKSLDIRAGVALVLAALKAQGVTEIDDSGNHIERGYADLGGDLQRLGAEISIA